MRRGTAIIGANYGDEGKGLMTDFFAKEYSHLNSVVIRFNGGANAGHTVCMRDGLTHVFHHMGSGTFRGTPTHLSKYFIVNPFLFAKEYKKFGAIKPKITIDPNTIVTIPYDMMLNQIIGRGTSCGVGINETVTRNEFGLTLKYSDLTNRNKILEVINEYKRTYYQIRKEILGFNSLEYLIDNSLFWSSSITESYLNECEFMTKLCQCLSDDDLGSHYKNFIFEGAQGLLLDQNNIFEYPYVTRSNTGLKNVCELAKVLDLGALNTIYVSRTYMTRHGNGPFNYPTLQPFFDSTNIPNEFQGTMRFGALNYRELRARIFHDYTINISSEYFNSVEVAMTHCDQMASQNDDGLSDYIKYKSFGPIEEKISVGQLTQR